MPPLTHVSIQKEEVTSHGLLFNELLTDLPTWIRSHKNLKIYGSLA